MTMALTFRYIAVETLIGMAIGGTLATAPILFSPAPEVQSLNAVAANLAPKIMMGAFMSAMVPALLTRWRNDRGGIDLTTCPSLRRTAVTAVLLATAFTMIVLALLYLVLAPLVGDSVGRPARLAVSGLQGIMSAAVLTPLTLAVLFGTAAHETIGSGTNGHRNDGFSDLHTEKAALSSIPNSAA